MRIKVVLEASEEGGYAVCVPSWLGCMYELTLVFCHGNIRIL